MQKIFRIIVISCACLAASNQLLAKQNLSKMTADQKQVTQWNNFSDELYALHKWQLSKHRIRTTRSSGGYKQGGYLGGKDFYQEVRYIDVETDKLLSVIQWETDNPQQVHSMEVYIYDDAGNLNVDYLVAYLPAFRNAPVQTLINFHSAGDGLNAFRQFDASGELIYEQCSGQHLDGEVDISLEDYELTTPGTESAGLMNSETYLACFGELSAEVGGYISPASLIASRNTTATKAVDSFTATEQKIKQLTEQLEKSKNTAATYVQRGELYFQLGDFDRAIADMGQALALDDELADAWFWRGMAQGRLGLVAKGIEDLSVFIKLRPNSSVGYTKRGVRYIWNGDLKNARVDLQRAVELDANNAEAHDDLGVVLVQAGEVDQATIHFLKSASVDPTYQKAHHNLATVLYLRKEYEPALEAVNRSLALLASSRSSLLLKSEILSSLGNSREALAIREQAEFLPEANWSEQLTMQ